MPVVSAGTTVSKGDPGGQLRLSRKLTCRVPFSQRQAANRYSRTREEFGKALPVEQHSRLKAFLGKGAPVDTVSCIVCERANVVVT
jgi:hypothetical protein